MAKLRKEELTRSYYEKLLLFAAMEYYTLKEEKTSGEEMKTVENAAEVLLNGGNALAVKEELEALRNTLMEKMDVLTAYVDKLEVYQYALNRVELRFAKEPENIDETAFVEKTMQYIFSSKDNMIINSLIKEIVGQLPVRMTKGKYFERIGNSLAVYTGADKASLDSMLYMLRTSSMLYHPKKEEVYYTEYKEIVRTVENLDFSAITKEEHHEAETLLEKAGEQLSEEMDRIILLAEAVNHFYGVYLLRDAIKEEERLDKVVREVLETSKAEDFEKAENALKGLEGRQEKLLLREPELEKGLFEADFEEPMIRELLMAQVLGSDSLFMEFNFEAEETAVTKELIEEETGKLTLELKELFSKHSMVINRAVMANTLSKLPVFFESSQEVMDYITNSLEQCHDTAEKAMSMKLIYHMMEE